MEKILRTLIILFENPIDIKRNNVECKMACNYEYHSQIIPINEFVTAYWADYFVKDRIPNAKQCHENQGRGLCDDIRQLCVPLLISPSYYCL